ncbi:MAG: hypothetical protein KCHDKBKB_01751 [Elusimicrobia bacterium]|nr:hypothetical protein [Elusimicrobiota bacterium]
MPVLRLASMMMLISPLLFSDEIILKEGKTIQGKITGEDSQEYTILMGSNMVLRVHKDKVQKVNRDIVPKSTRPIIRSDSQAPVIAASSVTVANPRAPVSVMPGSPTSPTPLSSPEKVQVPTHVPSAPVRGVVQQSTLVKNAVTVNRTLVISEKKSLSNEALYSKMSWDISWSGEADKENDQFKWKWALVRSTITQVVPDSTASISHFQNKRDLYYSSEESFAEQLSTLRAKDESALRLESNQLFTQLKSLAEKKQLGLERRSKKMFDESGK